MDGTHPNRKKDKLNPYTLSIENNTYYISFTDGQGVYHKQEITLDLYSAFDRFELDDISLINEASRHLSEMGMSEESLCHLIADPSEPMEDRVYRRIMYQKLHKAIDQLPDIQRRRVLLYYFEGQTYEQIARMEGCSKRAVKFSVDLALKKLKDYL